MNFVDQLEEAMVVPNVLADPYTAAVASIMPFFKDHGGFTREEITSCVLRILVEAGANVNRFYTTHYAYQARLGEPPLFPSPDTLARAVLRPDVEGGFISHDVHGQDLRHAAVFLAQIRAFAKDVGLQDGQFYVTLDGSPMVKYGLKAYESSRTLSELSEVALWARPIFRRKGDRSHPFFRGSTGGLEFLHCTVHTLDGKTSHTVYVDFSPKLDLRLAVQHCMAALANLKLKPLYIVVDKEFTGRGDVWEAIRDYADPRNILVVGPKVRDDLTQDDINRLWKDHLFQQVAYAGGQMWFGFLERGWSKTAKAYRPYGIAVAFEVVPYDFQPDDIHGMIVNEGEPGKSPRVAAFPIQVNKTVKTAAQFLGVLACIPRRWACEALFQRHEMRFARSKARDLFPRQLYYQLTLGALNNYGHWRAVKQAELTVPHDDATSMSWWIGDLRACLDHPHFIGQQPRLTPKANRKKRPGVTVEEFADLEMA